ncbi:MAG: type VI secretion system tube protein Hcp [Acidobacteriota bacterium]|nr:type VI secretion system tube protein Hcp [Acidobacteriota bacterium]
MTAPSELVVQSRASRRSRRSAWALSAAAAIAVGVLAANAGATTTSSPGATSPSPHFVGVNSVCSLSALGITGAGSTGGPGAIECDSWHFGATHAGGSRSGTGASRPKFTPLSVTRKIDVSSPEFYKYLETGKAIATLTLYAGPPTSSAGASTGNSVTYLFTHLQVTSIDWSGAGGEAPKETVTFSYSTLTETYTPGPVVG